MPNTFHSTGRERRRGLTVLYEHVCPDCGERLWSKYASSSLVHHRCSGTPPAESLRRHAQHEAEAAAEATAAGKRLGITPTHAIRYARALLRSAAAGFPTRTDAEVTTIWFTHCLPCEHLAFGSRCRKCGCRNAAKGWAIVTKAKMATEHCREGKW